MSSRARLQRGRRRAHRRRRACRSLRPRAPTPAWTTVGPRQAVREVPAERLDQDRRTSKPGPAAGRCSTCTASAELRRAPVTGTQDWTQVELVVRFRGERRDAGELPVRRMGEVDRNRVVRRCPLEELSARDAAAGGDRRTRHARGRRCRSTSTGSSSSTSGAASTAASGRRCSRTGSSSTRSATRTRRGRRSGSPSAVSMSKDGAVRRRAHAGRHARGPASSGGIEQGEPGTRDGQEATSAESFLPVTRSAGPVQVSLVWGAGRGRSRQRDRGSASARRSRGVRRSSFTAAAATDDRARFVITGGRQGDVPRRHRVADARRQRRGLPAGHAGAAARARLRPSIAGPAATSSAATTGATASAIATSARRARTRRGRASSTTTSGIHEFMAFCRLVKAEPYIAVNSGLGDVSSAADEVEYVNGAASTPMGKLRAANGHKEPYALPLLVDRQRDVRRLAARPHAA